jgi:hypothetical protein
MNQAEKKYRKFLKMRRYFALKSKKLDEEVKKFIENIKKDENEQNEVKKPSNKS